MSKYGIKLVWAGWDNEEVVSFSGRAYEQWKHYIEPGTRMLIYETTVPEPGTKAKGFKGIVGEIEVLQGFSASDALLMPTEEHERSLRVKVLRPRELVTPIPLDKVRAIIADPKFPKQSELWRPIFETVYRDLVKLWLNG